MSKYGNSISGSQFIKAVPPRPSRRPNYILSDDGNLIQMKKEKKKMGWFKKKFAKWCREAWENAYNEPMDTPVSKSNSIEGKTSTRFTIYPANGGFVIEHYRYDRYRDNEGPVLTIVNNGESIGTSVEHILTLDALKA